MGFYETRGIKVIDFSKRDIAITNGGNNKINFISCSPTKNQKVVYIPDDEIEAIIHTRIEFEDLDSVDRMIEVLQKVKHNLSKSK